MDQPFTACRFNSCLVLTRQGWHGFSSCSNFINASPHVVRKHAGRKLTSSQRRKADPQQRSSKYLAPPDPLPYFGLAKKSSGAGTGRDCHGDAGQETKSPLPKTFELCTYSMISPHLFFTFSHCPASFP